MASLNPLTTTASDQCAHLQHPNPATVTLASIILVGILISYLPQHIKIISRHSSEGLSPWWVLLGGLSSIAAIGNILVLPASREDVKCCKEVTGGECAAALLGVAQIGLQWGCFMFMCVCHPSLKFCTGHGRDETIKANTAYSVMLFLIFFPTRSTPADLSISTPSLSSTTTPPRRRDALLVTLLILAAFLATGLTSLATLAVYPHHTQSLANALGTIAGTLSGIQYLPQIYFTWKLKSVKSLSVVTMLIQVPGAFLFAFSLFLRVGWEGWSTWGVYVVTGCLQGVLLGLAVWYWWEARRDGVVEGEGEVEEDGEDVDERSALLERERRSRKNGTAKKGRPINGTQRSAGSGRGLDLLYAATPPEHDSDRSQ
ncbi:uncharacterized protein LTR77_009305 [Saxophila tyrrhenica]|uniref:Pq loop repeat protein n=1 Tax=Saxophila tyrrhenica TaxID=1690608 RepID=A0AAV9NYQ1_9PEZI|nr:hypothetical protein LTR77_009305 [Saxophila tyrrhenica]